MDSRPEGPIGSPVADDLLQSLQSVLAPTIGQGFFRSLVDQLVAICHVDFAVVGRLEPRGSDRVRMLAGSHRGTPMPDMEYDLRGTPCEHVVARDTCYFEGDLAAQYPTDGFLREEGIRAYLGTPLRGHDGRTLGLLAVLSRSPIPEPARIGTLVHMLAARAGAELERMDSERAAHMAEARLEAMFDHSPGVAMQWFDRDGRVLRWNAASEQMFGFRAAEAVGRTLDQLMLNEAEAAEFCARLRSTECTAVPAATHEYPFRRRDGSEGVCLSTTFTIPGEHGAMWFVCMDIDITGQKQAEAARQRLEAQVLHAQKLESLGVLAGGIAHDFNNLLTAILGHAALARADLPAASTAHAALQAIEQAAQRGAELTQQMLAYSGRGRFVIEPTCLRTLVQELSSLLGVAISKKASLVLDLAPANACVDATQVRQVVMNLITNASEALGDRPGTIRLQTGTRAVQEQDADPGWIDDPPPPGTYACLAVEDTGLGMDPSTRERIFDPFFTTKFAGRGLGLAAVLGIVRGHRGAIAIDSEPGRGTRFTVLFPAQRPAPGAAVAADTTPSAALTARILVVDDEPDVRSVIRRTLARAGAVVHEAADGASGLETFLAHRHELDAVLIDLTMPRMDGWELIRRIAALGTPVPILLMSGFPTPPQAPLDQATNPVRFLQKPFRPDELIQAVRALVEPRRPTSPC